MTYPNDDRNRRFDRSDNSGVSAWWLAAIAAALLLGFFIFTSRDNTTVARNDTPAASTMRPTTPAPASPQTTTPSNNTR